MWKLLFNTLNWLMSKIILSVVGIFLATILICSPALAAGPDLNNMLVLKYRVAVMSLSELTRDKQHASALFKTADPLAYFSKDGVVMELDDWATVVDLTKSELTKSDFLRVVELSKTLAKKDIELNSSEQPNLIFIMSYGVAGKERKLFTRLFEVSSGQIIFSTDSSGSNFKNAVRESITRCENWLLTQAWRCRVVGVINNQMVINRGQLDGLREGVMLIGYTLKNVPNGTKESDEAILLKYGHRLGTYTIVETRNNYSKLKATEGTRLLSEGDILEMPEVRLIDRDIKTRGNRLWDKIYNR